MPTFDEAVAEARDLASTGRRVILGIAGPPGAGKSTVAARFVAALADLGAAYLPMDGFHLSNAQLDRLGRRERKGAPDTFDVAGYIVALQRVRADRDDVYVPLFDRDNDAAEAAAGVVSASARVVVTEGNYLGLPTHGWDGVRALLDRLYYLEVSAAERRRRLLDRHLSGGRGRAAAQQWVHDVDDVNAERVDVTRRYTDGILTVD
ncbi:nucleoside/nucleotide kinase family protein [Mycobacterium sp. MYCO198283]|uniref:nucleoside/nucleotide kinase family protein n=1 Tax=Mycobacterium sp. MYCO198283 TaxID=2883505 RepID=UPI001E5BC692|nr:nucleoside/nucleotide kinase family protein [Mycobacterium sp. MYCO198283]MCG5434321.1 nucleoside/nucleotide kinase family protein [Mycobacterium sp. MYCO198283]